MTELIPKNSPSSSGPLNPLFLYADNVRLRDIQPPTPLSEAQRHRLVKGCKSPTEQEVLNRAYRKMKFEESELRLRYCEPSPESAVIQEHEYSRSITPHNTIGTQTVIEFREWQEAWRVRTEAECISGTLPPPQTGPRESSLLTSRGATKIAEACEYMHLKHGGFKTFVTGTFRRDVRELITSGKTTIQKEVTRTMDALQKMYQRGWTKDNGERVTGYDSGLPYVWVVEIPENEDGEPNPHIHMLLGWRVEYKDFAEWSARIEGIWGNGYFHLEKIKDSACAGAYMAKAAGYLCKAQDKEDQGLVKGNRYGMSKTARAPGWLMINRAQLHAMGQLIYDIYDHLTVKYGEKFRERKALNTRLSNIPKTHKAMRLSIGKRLAKVRAELNAIPIRCNKYQVVVTGKANALPFFSWLQNTSSESTQPDWLPEKPEGWEWNPGDTPHPRNSQFFSRLYGKFERNRFWRRLANKPDWLAWCDAFWSSAKHDYEREQDYNPYPHTPSFEQLCELGYA